jgi:hypothetical protein
MYYVDTSSDTSGLQATTAKNMAEEVQTSLARFWDEARLNAVISALLQHYFPLTVIHAASIFLLAHPKSPEATHEEAAQNCCCMF